MCLISGFDECFSVLVGKASVGGDWNVVLACAVSILGIEMKYKNVDTLSVYCNANLYHLEKSWPWWHTNSAFNI